MVSQDAAYRFQKAPFLANVDADSRQALLRFLKEERVKAGSILLKQGKLNDRIYFLIEGTVRVTRRSEPRDEHLLDLNAPTAFGETSYFQRKPQVVTIETVTEIWVLILDRSSHEQLRQEDPRASEQLALAAIEVLAGHFDLIDQRVTEILAQQPDSGRRTTEWDRFRARLFGESKL